MMSFWILALSVALLLWLVVKWFFINPAEHKFNEIARVYFDKQAEKRHGTVTVTNGTPALTIPYKTATINLAFISNDDDLTQEFTYARFRTEKFCDKKFTMFVNSKDLLLKPLVIGTRVELLNERLSEHYVVTGNDAAFVNRVLTQELGDKLLKLPLNVKFGRRIDSSRLSGERGWLTVFTHGATAGDEIFDALVETAILFYERLEGRMKNE
jgi:hypothetical protein